MHVCDDFPRNYFISPVEFPLNLSANFGELRTNAFHAGIDIRTGGVTGKRVLASADGFVYRIRVSPVGYGRALYIEHPNGLATVYAHLDEFSSEIEEYVKQEQYRRQEFDVDLSPPREG
jgi:murein DD-endopeptidase MepM/ murein hydrolase activator NlpD